MSWYKHPESGQVFEAVGHEEKFARQRGCVEVEPPSTETPAPAPTEEVAPTESTTESTTVEVEPPTPAPKKGGK